MREIVLDTETTGLDPLAGHRVVEVGCIELVNMVATGNTFHTYFNPEMIMPAGAQDIHGLSDEFLAEVYLELSGGRQRVLGLAAEIEGGTASVLVVSNLPVRPPRPHEPSAAELAAHVAFLVQISEPLWLKA